MSSNHVEGDGQGMQHIWQREEVNAGFWGNLNENAYLEDLGIDERILLNETSRSCLGGHGLA
jgi:hypothetical protein